MFNNSRNIVGSLAAAAVAVVAVSAFLAQKSQPFDVQRHAEAVEHLNAMVQMDQQLQRDVLLARHGVMLQYDPLVRDAEFLRQKSRAFKAAIHDVVEDAALASEVKALQDAVGKRLDKVEEFKPRNAISRNSLRYLPLAWRQYAEADDSSETKVMVDDATSAVRAAIDAYVSPTAESRRHAATAVDRFVPQSDEGRLLKRHAQRVIEADSLLAPLVKDLMQPTVLDAATVVRQEFKAATDTAIARSERWQVAFYVWGAALLALLIYAAFKLVFLYRNLDQLVRTRTAALGARTQELQLIFNTLDQGFVLVDSSGSLRPERSAMLEQWFGKLPPDGTVADIFASVDARLSDWLELAWDDVFGGILPPEMGLLQLPKGVTGKDGQSFSIDYKMTHGPDGNPQVLVVVSDATDAIRRRESEAAQRQTAAALQAIRDDRSGFVAFFKEMEQHLEVLNRSKDDATVKRTVHTLKGNAAFMGLEALHQWAADVEVAMETSGELVDETQRLQLQRQWMTLVRDIKPLIEDSAFDNVVVAKDKFRNAVRKLSEISQAKDIAATLFAMSTQPVEESFERAGRQAEQVAVRLEKYAPRIEVDDNGVRLDPESFHPFWSSLVHVVRNCVDHGLEDADEREQSGKYAQGLLRFHAERTADAVVISVSDDGRGIHWDQVRARAERQGIPSETREDLVNALFSTGLSTADEVTDISGRGVGLGAVKTVVQEFGGTIDVESEPGKGSTFRFTLPCDAEGQAVGRTIVPSAPSPRSTSCLAPT